MKLADLVLLFDRKYPGAKDAEVMVPGRLWQAWLREARLEATQRDEEVTGRSPARRVRGSK